MKRARLLVEYDGTAFAGWQRQNNAMTVQQRLEEAFADLTGERVAMVGASRTDAGVHALGQVAHFDTLGRIPGDKLALALNTRLPADVRVQASGYCSPTFHARYHACGKTYRYRIHNAPCAPALFRLDRAHAPLALNLSLMREAAEYALGRHDFSALCAAGSAVKDRTRTITALSVEREGALVTIQVSGDGFLYNMVRILAGTLMDVGQGRLPVDALRRAIDSRDRLCCGATAPACGLTLLRVHYPFDLPDLRMEATV